ncbi:MAG: type II secretion system protein [Planctomycetota bacterium]
MLSTHQHLNRPSPKRVAFTLVEMLVSVALVLLMMVMFAEIFSFATASMSKQKGLAELDQRQRLVSSMLRNDLQNRSFRNIYPYHSDDKAIHIHSANLPSNIPFDVRQGYFYISENDPENDNDDVLQFTITRQDGLLFYGKTGELLDSVNGNGAGANPDQPENDDGNFFGDGLGVGSSPSAEVAYFVRNGTLYRRILLIRRPLDSNFRETPSAGPLGDGAELIQAGIYPQASLMPMGFPPFYVANANINNRYPQDFDYSATNTFGSPPQLIILGESSLTNSSNSPLSLGLPQNRFGFQAPVALGVIGFPKEYVGGTFIGRFTQEETSHLLFAWPGNPGTGGDGVIAAGGDDSNPYTRTTGLSVNANGVVDLYRTDPTIPLSLITTRQGEDILLTNVQSFDIKVWDPAASVGPDGQPGIAGVDDDNSDGDNNPNTDADNPEELGWPGSDDGAWTDIGHAGQGFYAFSQRRNINFGPSTTLNNRCFDTWHPNLNSTLGQAPFRPALPGRDGKPGRAGVDDDNSDGDNDPTTGADDSLGEYGWPNTDDVPILLKAIQIRVRYLDISTRLVREVTIIEYLTPDAI